MRLDARASTVSASRDHGALPDWGHADLPAPAPFTPGNVARAIGPGIIGLGLAIGGGQVLVFGVGSLAGMALTAALTLQFVPAGTATGGWAVANMQAEAIAAVHGRVFWYLTVVCGFWVLFSTQLGVVDGVPRSATDVLWSGSPAVRRWSGGDVRKVYYTALVLTAAFYGLFAVMATLVALE